MNDVSPRDDEPVESASADATLGTFAIDDGPLDPSTPSAAPTQGALPLGLRTGDPQVDAALLTLADLEALPTSEHAEVFTQVHRALQDALVDLDRS